MRKSLSRVVGKRLSNAGKSKEKDDGGVVVMHAFGENEAAWVSTADGDFAPCTVLSHEGVFLVIRGKDNKTEQVDLQRRAVYPRNPEGMQAQDMTGLYHINDACILYNMQQRSYVDEPYTFMGNVLVSVNPLKDIAAPSGALGTSKAALRPHPFAIAEYAFQQMSFAVSRQERDQDQDLLANQSIIASGESGAGKTEASKRVLKHLVERTRHTETSKVSSIDDRLLKSNDITESFGNAQTLRNRNSSRFGKFMKLHFGRSGSRRDAGGGFHIDAASVETYLLERSRVTMHDSGERNYHVFYQLLEGRKNDFYLDRPKKIGFRYLAAGTAPTDVSVKASDTKSETHADDRKLFSLLETSMKDMGLSDDTVEHVFRVVAGVLHLGNVGFQDREDSEGDYALPVELEYDPLECAAELLGVDAKGLEDLLLIRSLQTRDGVIEVHRDKQAASFTRDAVAKGIYHHLFDFVVEQVNAALGKSESSRSLPFIGVLDIFGFESFKRNGFEQLLINFTNESLQSTFNRKVFQAEQTLYEQEGLLIDQDQIRLPPGNEAGMTLLAGPLKSPGSVDQARVPKDAVLVDLDEQCGQPQPSDAKMLQAFHRKFAKHPNFVKVHPRLMHENFAVRHYAGDVTYTVGNFVEKNNDALPKEVNAMFAGSSSPILAPIFKVLLSKQTGAKPGQRAAAKPKSIVKQFRGQVIHLLETLEATACSFIRCVKPNASMLRGKDKTWFSRPYVAHQLRHLSIPQTALVLRSGLPTRIRYDALVESYMSILPDRATKRFRKGGSVNSKLFVRALFWAFEIDPGVFKLGHTKVFFKAGEIATLDKVLQQGAAWANKAGAGKAAAAERERVATRFSKYYARLQWRRAYARALAFSKFKRLLELVRRRAEEERRRREEEARRRAQEEAMRKKAEEEAAEQARKQQEALEREAEENLQSLNRAMTIHKEATRASGGSSESDTDSVGSEEDGGDDDDDDDHDQSHAEKFKRLIVPKDESEEDRIKRLVREIEFDAETATEEEVARLEKRGSKKVSLEERKAIYERYEKQYLKEMARYEAMRRHNSELRQEFMGKLKKGIDETGTVLQRMYAQVQAHGLNLAAMFQQGLQERAPRLYGGAVKLQDSISTWLDNPVVKRTQDRLDAKLSAMDSAPNTLTRSATMAGGQAIKLNRAEVQRPVESAKKQVHALKALVEEGTISVEEMKTMLGDLEHALSRRNSRTWSERENQQQGVQLRCSACGAVNNTCDGMVCSNCKKDLDVPYASQDDQFSLPSKELDRWAGEAGLAYQGGEFYVQMKDQTRKREDAFQSVTVFVFECAWEAALKRKNSTKTRRKHRRWVVELESDQLEELNKKVAKVLKGGAPAFPRPKQAKRAQKTKGRANKLKLKLPFARKSKRVSTSKPIEVDSVNEYINTAQKWLREVIQRANAESKSKGAADSAVLKAGMADFFQLNENAKELRRYL